MIFYNHQILDKESEYNETVHQLFAGFEEVSYSRSLLITDVLKIKLSYILYLFMCLLNRLKANYEVLIGKETMPHVHKQKTIEGKVHHLENKQIILIHLE